MKRKTNWPGALGLFVAEKARQPFDWATNNCAFFAFDWVAILTGEDLAAPYRGKIDSAQSATRALAGVGGLEAFVERECEARGWPEVRTRLARRGDLVFAPSDDGPALGVCLGAQALFAGNVTRPMEAWTRAWRIA